MNVAETMKVALLLPPVSASGGAHSGNTYVDTQGWEHLRVLFVCGSLGANVGSTDAAVAPYVEQSDATGSGYAAVTSAALAAVLTGTTHNNTLHAIDIDLTKSHKRYMRVNAPTAGAGACVLSIVGILTKKSSGQFAGGASESGLTAKVSA